MPRGKMRRASLEFTASDRKLARDLARTQRRIRRWSKRAAGTVGGGFRSGFGQLASFASVSGIASAADDSARFAEGIERLGIQANLSREQTAAFSGEIAKLSDRTGVGRNALLGGAARFVSLTGNVDGARASLDLFARTSVATGASIDDVAATAAALRDNLNIGPRDMEKALSGLVVQGKAGAIELRELATLLSGIAPQMTRFGVDGTEGLAELGAALQVVRKGFGSGSEAVTGLNALMTKLAKNQGRLAAHGVKVFDKNPKTGERRMRRFRDIVDDISKSPMMKDDGALLDALGSSEATRAMEQLLKAPELFADLQQKSLEGGTIQRDYLRFQTSAAGKYKRQMQRVREAIAEAFTPERIAAFAEVLGGAVKLAQGLVGAVGKVAGFVTDVTGLGKDDTVPKADALSDPTAQASGFEIQASQLAESARKHRARVRGLRERRWRVGNVTLSENEVAAFDNDEERQRLIRAHERDAAFDERTADKLRGQAGLVRAGNLARRAVESETRARERARGRFFGGTSTGIAGLLNTSLSAANRAGESERAAQKMEEAARKIFDGSTLFERVMREQRQALQQLVGSQSVPQIPQSRRAPGE